MNKSRPGFSLPALWLYGSILCLPYSGASAETVFYAVDNDQKTINRFDPATGAALSTEYLTIPEDTIAQITGLAFDPVSGNLYGAAKLFNQGTAGRNLIIIDPNTGLSTDVGDLGQPIASLAFDANGTLYGVTGDCATGCIGGSGVVPETLFTINTTTADLTFFQTLGNGDDGEAIAFNPDDGMMYHMSGLGGGLIFEKIDLGTGAVTPIPLSGTSVQNRETQGFVYDAAANRFVGSVFDWDIFSGDYFSLTPDGVYSVISPLAYLWKDFAFAGVMKSVDVRSRVESLPGIPANPGGTATESDHWKFSVNNAGTVSIDVFSWRWDVDGDGVSHYMDAELFLYNDDGTLDFADFIVHNDDGPIGSDGSFDNYNDGQTSFDSYLSVTLPVGDYLLAITDYNPDDVDARSGVNDDSYYPIVFDGATEEYEHLGCTLDCSFGDYQIRFRGDINVVKPPRGDHDGDRKTDVLLRHSVTGNNQLYVMDGATISQNLAAPGVPAVWDAVGRGDYDGDGKADILWRHAPTGALWIYFMDGSVLLSSEIVSTVADSDWKVVASGDYNDDGKSDILWHHATFGTIWLYEMNGSAITSSTAVSRVPDTNWTIVGSGDYDGDGKSDLLWRHLTTGNNWMYLMDGPTISTSVGIGVAPDQNWKIVGNGDYNGDNRSDILWRHGATGTNWVYLMNGSVISTSASISVLPDLNWKIVGDGDYNGDGNADVLWRNTATGANRMYLMDGLTITSNAAVSTVVDQNWQIVNTK